MNPGNHKYVLREPDGHGGWKYIYLKSSSESGYRHEPLETKSIKNKRQMYIPTPKQEQKWSQQSISQIPTDEAIKEAWKKSHHGKEAGWGMGKRTIVLNNLRQGREYNMGLWQGKLDRLNGIPYNEERNDKTYNLGYFAGYDENPSGYKADAIKSNPNFSHLK
jgi:hypothetical protein